MSGDNLGSTYKDLEITYDKKHCVLTSKLSIYSSNHGSATFQGVFNFQEKSYKISSFTGFSKNEIQIQESDFTYCVDNDTAILHYLNRREELVFRKNTLTSYQQIKSNPVAIFKFQKIEYSEFFARKAELLLAQIYA
jgi:hypothetical protein